MARVERTSLNGVVLGQSGFAENLSGLGSARQQFVHRLRQFPQIADLQYIAAQRHVAVAVPQVKTVFPTLP